MSQIITAKIENLTYKPGETMQSKILDLYDFKSFDVNQSKSFGRISFNENNSLAYSKWVTPKRTRSYPFARIYETYNFGGKRVTIIPVIKDEGLGASKNKSNNDRVNFITLSWMNLTNVFVILAWYDSAERKSDYRITGQKLNDEYVKMKLKEISEYQLDAHHWNNAHFISDFVNVYRESVSAYTKIGKELNVQMHPSKNHLDFLQKIISQDDNTKIDLAKFAEVTLGKSKLAAHRETVVDHEQEYLTTSSEKLTFEIENNLGGKYYLTADEIQIDHKKKHITIREAKNTIKDKLPKKEDILDGLFKILLFSQILRMYIGDQEYTYDVGLRLTGSITRTIQLPTNIDSLLEYASDQNLSKSEQSNLVMLNEEAMANNYYMTINSNL